MRYRIWYCGWMIQAQMIIWEWCLSLQLLWRCATIGGSVFWMWSSQQPSHPPDRLRDGRILCQQSVQTRRSWIILTDNLFAIHLTPFLLLPLFDSLFCLPFSIEKLCLSLFFFFTRRTGNWNARHRYGMVYWQWNSSLFCSPWRIRFSFFNPIEFPLGVGSLRSLWHFLPCVVHLHHTHRTRWRKSIPTWVLSLVLLQKEHLQSAQVSQE